MWGLPCARARKTQVRIFLPAPPETLRRCRRRPKMDQSRPLNLPTSTSGRTLNALSYLWMTPDVLKCHTTVSLTPTEIYLLVIYLSNLICQRCLFFYAHPFKIRKWQRTHWLDGPKINWFSYYSEWSLQVISQIFTRNNYSMAVKRVSDIFFINFLQINYVSSVSVKSCCRRFQLLTTLNYLMWERKEKLT